MRMKGRRHTAGRHIWVAITHRDDDLPLPTTLGIARLTPPRETHDHTNTGFGWFDPSNLYLDTHKLSILATVMETLVNEQLKEFLATIHCKKYFQDLLSQHIFFCQIKFSW